MSRMRLGVFESPKRSAFKPLPLTPDKRPAEQSCQGVYEPPSKSSGIPQCSSHLGCGHSVLGAHLGKAALKHIPSKGAAKRLQGASSRKQDQHNSFGNPATLSKSE